MCRLAIQGKSLVLKFPLGLSKNLIRHFIRGYFDGDGCIHISKKEKTYHFSIAGTRRLLRPIQKILIKNCGLNKTKIMQKRNTYYLAYCGRIQVPRILDYLYKDSITYLDRKYKKYLRIKKEYAT